MWTKFWSSVYYIWCSLRIVWVPKYLASSTSQVLPFMRHIGSLRGSGHLHSRVAAILSSHPTIVHFQYPWVSTNCTYTSSPLASLREHQTCHIVQALTSRWPFISSILHCCGFSFTISLSRCQALASLHGTSAPQNQYHMANSYTFLSEGKQCK